MIDKPTFVYKNLKLIALLTLLSEHNYVTKTQRESIKIIKNSYHIYREIQVERREHLSVSLMMNIYKYLDCSFSHLIFLSVKYSGYLQSMCTTTQRWKSKAEQAGLERKGQRGTIIGSMIL